MRKNWRKSEARFIKGTRKIDNKRSDLSIFRENMPANSLTLDKLREFFKQENKGFKLKIRRGEEVLELNLKTRKLL